MSIKKISLMLLMIVATIAAIHLRPTHKIATDRKDFVLEKIIPMQFGDWQFINATQGIVNPQQEEMINKIYSQTLSRTYVNKQGELVMLVIAYGEDQGDNTQVHYPEVCYPAQGFQITSERSASLETDFGSIPVRKLVANLSSRVEAITYWTTIGDISVLGGKETKLAKLKYAMHGDIADGLLFRVSIISDDINKSYETQEIFIKQLINEISAVNRKAIAGL